VTTNNSSLFNLGNERIMTTSTAVKDWRGRVRTNLSATTSRSCETSVLKVKQRLKLDYTMVQSGFVNYHESTVNGGAVLQGYFTFQNSAVTPVVPLALQRFFAQVYESTEKFEGATECVELQESIEALRHPLRELHKLFNDEYAWRKFRPITKKGMLRALAATWLEAQFNIAPTISAISGLLETANRLSSADWVVRISSKASDLNLFSRNSVQDQQVSFTQDVFRCRTSIKETTTHTTWCKGALLSRAVRPYERYGFDVTSWVLAGWERIPASFLVDYVLPIGEYIESMSGRARNTLAWGSQTTVKTVRSTITGVPVPKLPSAFTNVKLLTSVPLEAKGLYKRLDRSAIDNTTGISLPAFFVKASPRRLLNAIALAITARNIGVARY
jgi:hypothetical protein